MLLAGLSTSSFPVCRLWTPACYLRVNIIPRIFLLCTRGLVSCSLIVQSAAGRLIREETRPRLTFVNRRPPRTIIIPKYLLLLKKNKQNEKLGIIIIIVYSRINVFREGENYNE